MDKRIGIILWSVTAFFLLWGAALNIIKGHLLDLATASLFLAPFLFILILQYRKHWHVLIPIFLAAVNIRIPVYGLQSLNPAFVLLFITLIILIFDRCISHSEKKTGRRWEDNVILIIAILLTARMVYDRPGFVALGMEEGGFIRSMTYVMATWFYFVAQSIVKRVEFSRKQLWFATGAVFLISAFDVIKGIGTGVLITRYFGGPSFWMLAAMLLSLLATATPGPKQNSLFYLASLVFLFLGMVSSFRSRMFFYAAEIFSVAWFTRRTKRTVLVVGIGAIIGVALILNSKEVPLAMRRSLSLFMNIDKGASVFSGVEGAYGWEDTYRSELYRMAWVEVQKHPFVGRGFGLNVEEAIGILISGQRAGIHMLALSASYHNSVVALAVTAGLPIAILFSLVSIAIPIRFARMNFKANDQNIRVWGITIFAFWCSNTGMLLMNGGPIQFFTSMILNGYMMGMMQNPAVASKRQEEEVGDIDCREKSIAIE